MPATVTPELQEAKGEMRKARKPRKKSPYILQRRDDTGAGDWRNFPNSSDASNFPDDKSCRKFVRTGEHAGSFRVIRVVSEFTSAIEERKVARLT